MCTDNSAGIVVESYLFVCAMLRTIYTCTKVFIAGVKTFGVERCHMLVGIKCHRCCYMQLTRFWLQDQTRTLQFCCDLQHLLAWFLCVTVYVEVGMAN